MKKRIKSIIMAAMMLLSVLAICDADMKTAYAEGDITVTFHYSREDGIYDSEHYSLCVWTDVQGGSQYLFFDASGTTSVTLVGNPTSLGFFIKDVQASASASADGSGGIVKDTGADRTIDLTTLTTNTLDVYLTAGVTEYTTTTDGSVAAPVETSASTETTIASGVNEQASETATQMTSDDPNADYSPSSATIVIVDLLIIVAVAVISYQIYSRQKNPITGN